MIREFPSTEIPRPLESGIQFDSSVGWELTDADVERLMDLEARFERVTVQIVEPLIPTAIWDVYDMIGV